MELYIVGYCPDMSSEKNSLSAFCGVFQKESF